MVVTCYFIGQALPSLKVIKITKLLQAACVFSISSPPQPSMVPRFPIPPPYSPCLSLLLSVMADAKSVLYPSVLGLIIRQRTSVTGSNASAKGKCKEGPDSNSQEARGRDLRYQRLWFCASVSSLTDRDGDLSQRFELTEEVYQELVDDYTTYKRVFLT